MENSIKEGAERVEESAAAGVEEAAIQTVIVSQQLVSDADQYPDELLATSSNNETVTHELTYGKFAVIYLNVTRVKQAVAARGVRDRWWRRGAKPARKIVPYYLPNKNRQTSK